MTEVKKEALDILGELQREDKISYSDYLFITDALDEIDTLAERDEELEDLWDQFSDVPMNPDTEKIEGNFLHFQYGTEREDIWHWFDERHSKGVAYLLYGG